MAQHRVTYTEIHGLNAGPIYIKTACNICGPLGTFHTQEEADRHAQDHIRHQ